MSTEELLHCGICLSEVDWPEFVQWAEACSYTWIDGSPAASLDPFQTGIYASMSRNGYHEVYMCLTKTDGWIDPKVPYGFCWGSHPEGSRRIIALAELLSGRDSFTVEPSALMNLLMMEVV